MTNTPIDATTKRLVERSDGAQLAKDGTIYDEEIRYCWIDEDGARMSPVHRDFGKALSFITDWPANMQRALAAEQRAAETVSGLKDDETHYAISDAQRRLEKAGEATRRMSLTGKRPIALRRLVMRTTTESLADYEAETTRQLLENLGAS